MTFVNAPPTTSRVESGDTKPKPLGVKSVSKDPTTGVTTIVTEDNRSIQIDASGKPIPPKDN